MSSDEKHVHVFDVADREGIMGDITAVYAASKAEAQGTMEDSSLNSEFDKHAKAVGDNRYVSQSGEELVGKEMIATLDGESVYDGVDYLGVWDDAFGEVTSRLATGRARDVTFYEPAREHVSEDSLTELLAARDAGQGVSR